MKPISQDCRVVILGIDPVLYSRCVDVLDGIVSISEVGSVAALKRWPGDVVLVTAEAFLQRGLELFAVLAETAPDAAIHLIAWPEQVEVLQKTLGSRLAAVHTRPVSASALIDAVRDRSMSPTARRWDGVPVAPPTGYEERRRCFRVLMVEGYRAKATIVRDRGSAPAHIINLAVANNGSDGGLLLSVSSANAGRVDFPALVDDREFDLDLKLPSGDLLVPCQAKLVGLVRPTLSGDFRFACTYRPIHPSRQSDLLKFWVESQKRGIEKWGRMPGAFVNKSTEAPPAIPPGE